MIQMICENAEISENRRFEESVVAEIASGFYKPSYYASIDHHKRVIEIHRAWSIETPSKEDPSHSVSEQVITEHMNKIVELRAAQEKSVEDDIANLKRNLYASRDSEDESREGVWQVVHAP